MKKMLTKLILLVLLLVSGAASPAQNKPSNPIEGKWVLESLLDSREKAVWTKKPELVFNSKEKTVSGFDGCNVLMGKFRQSDNKTLRLESITGTLKACPGNSADRFLNTLDQIDHYRIRNGKLELLKGTKVLLRLFRN